ncbi:MAG TPA: ABC-type transport auxiliary lipoprotein family protein [Steroidobacteraceae bacterium]|nr:ABC-type transport auxiliary lipoprotein family protein [Steroidobacteraceae bacterium]
MRALLAAGVLLSLGACSGSFFRSHAPPPTTFLLSVKPQGASSVMPAEVTVVMPRVRTGLDTDRIAALYPDHRLDYFAGARWSGPLDEVVQDLAMQALRGRFRNVRTDTSAFTAGYWVEIEVVDFQAEYAASSGSGAPPTAHVRLLGRVGTADDRRLLGEFEADAREPAASNHLSAIVAAYNEAAAAALAKVAVDTAAALARAPSARALTP